MPTQKLLERKALIVGIVINVLQVLAGMAVFFMTGLKAMFLDFSFTAISVLSGMVAVYLSSRTVRTTERFPNGMFALEPIYAICKAIFTMSLLVYSLIDVCRVAYDYFVFGSGERIETGPVVIYEILTVIVCFSLYTYYRRSNRSIGDSSTMLTAECKSTLVDGSMSFGIGVVAIFLMLLPAAVSFAAAPSFCAVSPAGASASLVSVFAEQPVIVPTASSPAKPAAAAFFHTSVFFINNPLLS